ncbi:SusC/RagA family TonB-linked outer membrane protein [Reichenbachiella versicolor]|uniref:SusC/RagA family TonB-linked outer membrane protein n=1 Tax=Reichenbachiella versicolor TaxID=1821036 RepID=UPI000D6EA585|nr:SusC/RagA family TonB-linked outer membrane protein [Reichenbachiella versicolor]
MFSATAIKQILAITHIFCFGIMSSIAEDANAQDVKKLNISLRIEEVSLVETFEQIEELTGLRFLYSSEVIKISQKVSLHAKNEPLEFVLNSISKQVNVSFKLINNTISVKKELSIRTSQTKKISGIIVDADTGDELIGATVKVKGTNRGTITDIEGKYSVEVTALDTLEVAYVGYKSVEENISKRSIVDIKMESDISQLDEVVVVALNVRKKQKAIGYSTQKISGVEIQEANEPNLINALNGKIAGAQITNTNGGIGASSTIILRGYNSLSGNNQPLFVVDGIPISNMVHQTSRAFGGAISPNQSGFLGEGFRTDDDGGEIQVDFGNSAAEINPSDIETIQVLKGATAAALYGARAANGALLITTKSGASQRGLGVSFRTSISVQTPLKTPNFQTQFGKGINGLYSFPYLNSNSARNFGPKFTGQLVDQYNPYHPNDPRSLPWVNGLGSDPIRDFLELGITQNYSLSITNSFDSWSYRFSYSRLNQKGMIPNTDLLRNSLMLNVRTLLGKKIKVSIGISYINSGSKNRPEIGAKNSSNIVYTFLRTGTNERLDKLKNYWEPQKEGEKQATSDRKVNNPFFLAEENINSNTRYRVMGNVLVDYKVTNSLTFQLRTGRDFYRDNRIAKKPFSHFPYSNGFYAEASVFYVEENSDALLTYEKGFGLLSLKVIGGGNRLNQRTEELRASTDTDGLVVPGLFNLSNSRSPTISGNYLSRKSINSLYGGVTIGFDDYLFLEITGRNDWSSALPLSNNSFFYPSVSLSGVISDIINFQLTSPEDYIKTRISYAAVGNDTSPYQTDVITINGRTNENITINTVNGTLGNSALKPEDISSIEAGVETRLLDDRLFLDATIYSIKNKQQIAVIPVAAESGFLKRIANIPATITNKGIELTAVVTPVKTDRIRWDLTMNWSQNVNRVSGLKYGDSERIILAERWINLDVKNNGSYGDFYGDFLLKVDESGQYGQQGSQVYQSSGQAEESDDGDYNVEAKPILGNGVPDWIAGIKSTISYKGFSFGCLFDINYGGRIHSRTYVSGNRFGALKESVKVFRRDNAEAVDLALQEGHKVVDGEQWIVLDGAIIDRSTGEVMVNRKLVARVSKVYEGYFDNDAIGTFDRTFVKLRELKISYRFPSSIIRNLSLEEVNLTVFGRNLMLWDNVPHIDPETAGYSGELVGGEFFSLPSARSFGFSLTAKF